MEKQQRFCVSSSSFAAKKIQNSNKRKERDHQEAESEVFTGLRSQSSSAVSSIVSSRTPGRVLKEPRLSNDNWVNKRLTLLVVIPEVMKECYLGCCHLSGRTLAGLRSQKQAPQLVLLLIQEFQGGFQRN